MYIEQYRMRTGNKIKINKQYDDLMKVKCPTCRKQLTFKKKRLSVYVHTDCVCCLNSISKAIVLSCKHANICYKCYKKLKKDPDPYPSLFVFENGNPVSISRTQMRLYKDKSKLGYLWCE